MIINVTGRANDVAWMDVVGLRCGIRCGACSVVEALFMDKLNDRGPLLLIGLHDGHYSIQKSVMGTIVPESFGRGGHVDRRWGFFLWKWEEMEEGGEGKQIDDAKIWRENREMISSGGKKRDA